MKKDIVEIEKEAKKAAIKAVDNRFLNNKITKYQRPKIKSGKKDIKLKSKPKIIVISGTPCTGKTTLSRLLEKELGMQHLDVARIIRENSLSEGYDPVKKCEIIDPEKLKKALITLIRMTKKNVIIDSHMSHYLPNNYVDLCIITKCSLKTLKYRLNKRGYHKQKIKENLDSEIFDICMVEALEAGHDVLIVETDKETDIEKIKARLRKNKG